MERPRASSRPHTRRALSDRPLATTRRRRTIRRGAPLRERPKRHRRGHRREVVRERLIESRLTPNAISLTGLALNVLAAALVWEQLFLAGGIAFVVGSIMDTLDGRYSRMSGKGTPFGAFLDSTLDRVEEGIVLTAVAARFAAEGSSGATAAVVIAVLASLMVSYTRARAEALGVACAVGIAPRAVRVSILAIGLIFARGASLGHFSLLAPAVYVLATLSVVTVLQRVWHVRRELLGRTTHAPTGGR
jgi:phosphatidylinositol phosphate synthase